MLDGNGMTGAIPLIEIQSKMLTVDMRIDIGRSGRRARESRCLEVHPRNWIGGTRTEGASCKWTSALCPYLIRSLCSCQPQDATTSLISCCINSQLQTKRNRIPHQFYTLNSLICQHPQCETIITPGHRTEHVNFLADRLLAYKI